MAGAFRSTISFYHMLHSGKSDIHAGQLSTFNKKGQWGRVSIVPICFIDKI